VYAGGDPADTNEAWDSLDSAREKGAEYLLIPAKSFWWRDDYQKFREQLKSQYAALVRDEASCIIFDLRDSSQRMQQHEP
jgi:hypothetical protein